MPCGCLLLSFLPGAVPWTAVKLSHPPFPWRMTVTPPHRHFLVTSELAAIFISEWLAQS